MPLSLSIEEVLIYLPPEPPLWPLGPSTDFSELESRRSKTTYRRGADSIEVTTRFHSAFSAYPRSGVMILPTEFQPAGHIDNTKVPPDQVVSMQVKELQSLAKECQVIRWLHGHQCSPAVAAEMKRLFPLTILCFGDDCPGSSEKKTFPVWKYFDALLHRMYIWDYESGLSVPQAYTKYGQGSGTGRFYHHVGGPTDHLTTWLTEHPEHGLEKKCPSRPFGFLGAHGQLCPHRFNFIKDLCSKRALLPQPASLYGHGMPEGYLPILGTEAIGQTAARLYSDVATSMNIPMSSIFNGRFHDLPLSGVQQILHDKHGELSMVGLYPDEHYLQFDGTVNSLIETAHKAHESWPSNQPPTERTLARLLR